MRCSKITLLFFQSTTNKVIIIIIIVIIIIIIIIRINNNQNYKFAWIRNSRLQLAQDIQHLGSKVKVHPNNKTKTRSQNTYHIVHPVGKQGTRPPGESNQPEVEKCTTESTTSLEKHSDGNQAQEDLPE